MKNKPLGWIAIVVLLLSIVLVPMAGTAADPVATGSGPETKVGDIIGSPLMGVSAVKVWTRQEMLAAEPYPMPEANDDAALVRKIDAAMAAGVPGFDLGGLPGGAKGATASGAEASEAAPAGGPGVLGYTYPAPYTGFEVFSAYTVYPYKTVGKVFFRQRRANGTIGSFVCSGASIGNYAIWTAGHCVHSGNNNSNGWSTNFVFVPAYKNGAAPYGQFTQYQLFTRSPWYASANLRADMGAAVVRKNASGNKISSAVGWLGFAWTQGYQQHWNSLGYPAQSPFNGLRLRTCEASYAYSGTPSGSGPVTVGIGCNMGGGASGGPWILSFSGVAGASNYLNGENSYTRVYGSGVRYKEMFSPYFDANAKSLRDAAVAVNVP